MPSRRIGSLLVLTLCAACVNPPTIAGVYQLATLNGRTLPAQDESDTCAARALAGSLSLGSDLTWRASLTEQKDPCRESLDVDTSGFFGHYAARGRALTLVVDSVAYGQTAAYRWNDSLQGSAHRSYVTLNYRTWGGAPVVFLLRRLR
jgi:hypothetical protein